MPADACGRATAPLDRTLAAAIETTLRRQVASRVALGDDACAGGLGVRIMPVTAEADDSFQLLRAVAILEAARRGGVRRLRRPELTLTDGRSAARRGIRFGASFCSGKGVDASGRREYVPRAFDRQ